MEKRNCGSPHRPAQRSAGSVHFFIDDRFACKQNNVIRTAHAAIDADPPKNMRSGRSHGLCVRFCECGGAGSCFVALRAIYFFHTSQRNPATHRGAAHACAVPRSTGGQARAPGFVSTSCAPVIEVVLTSFASVRRQLQVSTILEGCEV